MSSTKKSSGFPSSTTPMFPAYLPPEIICMILEHLANYQISGPVIEHHENQIRQLALCSIVNKTWHFCVEEVLYRTYIDARSTRDWPNSSLHKFLRTLEERPDILRHVKILALGSWDSPSWQFQAEWNRPVTSSIMWETPEERMEKHHDEPLLQVKKYVRRELKLSSFEDTFLQGKGSAAVGLLLHWTPNVEQLHLPVLDEDTQLLLPQYERPQSPLSEVLFTHLKKIVIHGTQDARARPMSFKALHQLLKITSLEVFEMHKCRLSAFPPVGLQLSSAYSIRRLSIHDSVLEPKNFEIIMEKIHRLEHLEYSYKPANCEGVRINMRYMNLGFNDLFEAFETHQSTLQTLTIKGPFEGDSPPLAIPHFRKSFTAMKSLDVEEHCLLGQEIYLLWEGLGFAQRLPASLTHLSISSCSLQTIFYVKDLILEAHEYLPNLKSISLEAAKWSRRDLPPLRVCECTSTVDDLCELAGIDFKLVIPRE